MSRHAYGALLSLGTNHGNGECGRSQCPLGLCGWSEPCNHHCSSIPCWRIHVYCPWWHSQRLQVSLRIEIVSCQGTNTLVSAMSNNHYWKGSSIKKCRIWTILDEYEPPVCNGAPSSESFLFLKGALQRIIFAGDPSDVLSGLSVCINASNPILVDSVLGRFLLSTVTLNCYVKMVHQTSQTKKGNKSSVYVCSKRDMAHLVVTCTLRCSLPR